MTGEINSDRGHLQRKSRRAQYNQLFPEEMSKRLSALLGGGIARGSNYKQGGGVRYLCFQGEKTGILG